MTQEQFEKKIQDKIRTLKAGDIIFPAAQHALDSLRQRLFGRGIGGDDKSLGQYSTTPMYASKSQFKRTSSFRGQGKYSKKDFANGKPRRSMYLANGYKELRGVQGYETGFVNLQYSGDLFTDMTKLTPEKDSVVLRLSRAVNLKKVEGLKAKYGPDTFKHTQKERDEFGKNVMKELTKYFRS